MGTDANEIADIEAGMVAALRVTGRPNAPDHPGRMITYGANWKILGQVLEQGEHLERLHFGRDVGRDEPGLLAATDRRVILIHHGEFLRGKFSFGQIYYPDVLRVVGREGFRHGSVTVEGRASTLTIDKVYNISVQPMGASLGTCGNG